MQPQKNKKRIISSSAALISIAVHVLFALFLGGIAVFQIYSKRGTELQVEQKPKLERRQLQMPKQAEPFIEQMSKPSPQTSSRITATRPQSINLPDQGTYSKMAPLPSFTATYTNTIAIDRTLEFNSRYRETSFGIADLNFFGTKGKAERVALLIDVSKAMLYDECGGADSYIDIRKRMKTQVLSKLKSATLFNLILYDHEHIAMFSPSMIPATPSNREKVLEWFGGFNTNLMRIGISNEQNNYTPKRTYTSCPMAPEDRTGWLKGLQAASEQHPEIIFLLAAEWGNTTTRTEKLSYFINHAKFREYQEIRAAHFLEMENKDLIEGYEEKFESLRTVAMKMIELENEARLAINKPPKVMRDWDIILTENKVNIPNIPKVEEPGELPIATSETRYTTAEVLESVFKITLANYRQMGFPQLNIVMLSPRYQKGANNSKQHSNNGWNANDSNPDVTQMRMTSSQEKFEMLAKVSRGRFRFLKGLRPIQNELSQSRSQIEQMIEEEEEFEKDEG